MAVLICSPNTARKPTIQVPTTPASVHGESATDASYALRVACSLSLIRSASGVGERGLSVPAVHSSLSRDSQQKAPDAEAPGAKMVQVSERRATYRLGLAS